MIDHIETIGLLAGFLALIAWIPQFQTVWFKRLHLGLDLRTLGIILSALLIWCVYGYLKQAWAICISNAISGFMIISIMLRVRHLRRVEPSPAQVVTNMVEAHAGYGLSEQEKQQFVTPDTSDPADTPESKLLEQEFPWGPRVPAARDRRYDD